MRNQRTRGPERLSQLPKVTQLEKITHQRFEIRQPGSKAHELDDYSNGHQEALFCSCSNFKSLVAQNNTDSFLHCGGQKSNRGLIKVKSRGSAELFLLREIGFLAFPTLQRWLPDASAYGCLPPSSNTATRHLSDPASAGIPPSLTLQPPSSTFKDPVITLGPHR